MKLTEAMRFLSPAIDKKNRVLPVLEHVRITQNYAIAYNGMLALAAPVSIPLDCTPNGIMLEQAVKRFGDEYTATQRPNGNLFFKGNGFEVTVPCTTDLFPMPDFSGTPLMPGAGFVAKLKKLIPFADPNDIAAPWKGGILIRNGKACATCGHTFAFCPVDVDPSVEVLIPLEAAEAMVSIAEEPEYLARSESRLVAVYSGGRFLSTPLIHTTWPAIDKIGAPPGNCGVLPGFFAAVHAVEPFGIGSDKGEIFLRDGYVSSARDDNGAKAEVPGLVGNWFCLYAALKLIEKHCKNLNLSDKFASWSGDGIEGRMRLGGPL